MKRFEMAFPESVEETAELLTSYENSRLVAGGTALTVVMKQGVYRPDVLINVRGLEDSLRYIRESDSELHIGALATLRDMERNDAVRRHIPTVIECIQEIAGVRVRNSATIGGHLAHADVHLDLPPVLAGLNAEVVLTSASDSRRLPVSDFLLGYYQTDLKEGELITEVVVPKPDSNTHGVYLKHRYYSEVDWPCVGVAAFAVDAGDSYEDVRVLLNSVSHQPVLTIDGVDETVDGSLTNERIEAVAELVREQVRPSDDLRGSAAYKRRMAGVFTRRALKRINRDELNLNKEEQ